MTPEEMIQRANAAKRIMDDTLVKDALDMMEREVTDAWLAVPARDVEGREFMWRLAVTTRKFRDILRGTMEAGKVAQDQLKRKENVMERVGNFIRREA